MDSQQIEIIGRNRLINELLEAGLEVAEPIRDRGVDLIAYHDIDDDNFHRFVAFPIQLKVSSESRFTIVRKYDRFPNLIMAYVWGVGSGSVPVTYGLTQREATGIAEIMGWTKTRSWAKGGYTTPVSRLLLDRLEPYKMTPPAWKAKLLALIQSAITETAVVAHEQERTT